MDRLPTPMMLLGQVCLLATGCPDIPKECGTNVAAVTQLSFKGPDHLDPTVDGGQAFYDQTIVVEKEDPQVQAMVCVLVRDQDWFLSPDDLLLQQLIGVDGTQRTVEFGLEIGNDGDVCGSGPVALVGCSGETEAEVYLQVADHVDGLTEVRTPIQRIRVQ